MGEMKSIEEISDINKLCRILNTNTKLLAKHLNVRNNNHIFTSIYNRISKQIRKLDNEKDEQIYKLENTIDSLAYEIAKYKYPNQYGFSDEQIDQIIREHSDY